MEYALPETWGNGSRGFWTKRRKSATSLLAVLALIAGIAVAFKLFDRRVPNNVVRDAAVFDFQVHVQRTASQGCTAPVSQGTWCDVLDPNNPNPIFAGTEFVNGVEVSKNTFPGDSRTENVRIINSNKQPAKDADFETYVDQASIVVRKCADVGVAGNSDDFDPATGECLGGYVVEPDGANKTRFLNFWTLEVRKEAILHVDGQEVREGDLGNYPVACSGSLREITKASPCGLGTVRASGKTNVLNQKLDERLYRFTMKEADDGTDQSAFKGWTVTWTFVFQARVPAAPHSSTPVHED